MIASEFGIEGNIAIVTGAARGIGKAIALTLAESGADVVVTDILEEVEQTADEIRGLGVKSLAVIADIRSTDQVESMVARTIAEFGRIDILVANAGVEAVKPVITVEGKAPTPDARKCAI